MTKYSYLSSKPATKSVAKKKTISFKLNSQYLKISLMTLIVTFGIGYLIQINGLATKGYQIRELESQISELKITKSDLELDALSLRSMNNVSTKVADLGMVKAGEADYLTVTPVAVAR